MGLDLYADNSTTNMCYSTYGSIIKFLKIIYDVMDNLYCDEDNKWVSLIGLGNIENLFYAMPSLEVLINHSHHNGDIDKDACRDLADFFATILPCLNDDVLDDVCDYDALKRLEYIFKCAKDNSCNLIYL